MKIVLDKERPISLNNFYSGVHWATRREEADRVHQLVKYSLPRGTKLFIRPVNILIIAYFSKMPLDSDNICGKLYIDGLKPIVILDDDYKYVRRVSTESRIDRLRPRVELIVEEID